MQRGKMMPIGPLMIEHRLIEKMIDLMFRELERLGTENRARPGVIRTMVDFIRTYADRCHHGKEEDILFRELRGKALEPEHERIMNSLVNEHRWARGITGRLAESTDSYEAGNQGALPAIAGCLQDLCGFYPGHIEKEDRHFFRPVMEYFSPAERDAMLDEELEFDRNLIHRMYSDVVERTSELFR